MTTTRRSNALALAASGLLLIAMTGTGFAQHHGGQGHQPTCTGSCQTNKAGNPGTVFTNGPAGKSGVGNASGGKNLKQN